jgi:succinoglycan biosynthesis protein ExoM
MSDQAVQGRGIGRIAICICTFQRPAGIRALLDSLVDQVLSRRGRVVVVVVDNDPAAGAGEVVRAHPIQATYLHEPVPGIAQARNRSVEAALPVADWLFFVDDDEQVSPEWITAFEHHIARTGARVVSGPVKSVFPPGTPNWILQGGFIQLPTFLSGPWAGPPNAGNTAVDAQLFRDSPALRFSPEYGLTGGEDTELFTRLGKRGVAFEYCAEAWVQEPVLESRANWRWIFGREARNGNNAGRMRLERHSRLTVAGYGAARVAYGCLRTIAAVLTGRGLRHVDILHVFRGIGTIEAALGAVRAEYSRPAAQ